MPTTLRDASPWTPVVVNGCRISTDLGPGPWLGLLRVDSERDPSWLRIPLETAEAPISTYHTHPAPYSVLVILGEGVPSGVEYLIYGRSYLAPLAWELPGLRIVVATDRLSRDLSQLYLVEDEAYRNLQQHLWEHVCELLGELETRRGGLSLEKAAEALPFLDFLAECQLRSGRPQQAQDWRAWRKPATTTSKRETTESGD